MLLTSWVRSFRQSLQNRRRQSRRARNEQQLLGTSGHRSRVTEQLEDRLLLTSLVFDSTNVNPAVGIQVNNSLLDPDNDGVSNFERVVIDSVSFPGDGGRGVSIDLSDLTGLQSIVIESLTISGTGGTGVDISLNNISLVDGVIVDSSSITSTTGGGIDVNLTDVKLGTLTIFDTTVSSGPGVGVNINVNSVTKNSVLNGLDISSSILDGVSITSDGATGVISDATNDPQIRIFSIDHGLQPDARVTIEDVTGNVAANTTDTIISDPGDADNFFILANTSGLVGVLPGGILNDQYAGGGTWTLPTTLSNIRITGSTITDTTLSGEEGIILNLRNTETPNLSISDNVEIKGIQVDLDNSPVDGLSIRNNALIDSSSVDGIGFTAVGSFLTDVRVEGNTIQGDGANGGAGISWNLTDSNFDGFIADNTIIDTLGDGLLVTPFASDGFVAENGGPLRISFTGRGISNNTFANTSANNVGAGLQFDLPKNTAIAATISGNTVTGFREGGLDFAADDTTDAFDLTITDNRFDSNLGNSIAVVLEDAVSGVFDISRNTITRAANIVNGDNGNGVFVSLIGIDTNREATNILKRSTIADNRIGVASGGRLAVPLSAANGSLIVDDISGFTTSIVNDISSTDTTITVLDAVRLPPTPNPRIRIGNEELTVTAVNGNVLTVTRGVNGTVAAAHDATASVLPLTFSVIVDGERMVVTNVVNNTFTVSRTNEDTNGDGFLNGGEDSNGNGVFDRRIAHSAGAAVLPLHGGNAGSGVVVNLEEQSEIQDLLINGNFIANHIDDGIKFERDDDGRLTIVNPRADQTRALTISNNAIMANAAAAFDDINAGGGLAPFGAGIDIIARNGALDTLDFEIRGNTISGNTGNGARGISLRAEADANILADIAANKIQFNSDEGIEVTTRFNDGLDERDVSGTWIANTISNNGNSGILLNGDFGTSPLSPVVIGLEGIDPVSGLSRGNLIEENGDDGIEIDETGRIGTVAITNNSINRSGRNGSTAPNQANPSGIINGAGINVREPVNIAVKNNTFIENAGIGIDLNAIFVTASIRGNLITRSGNDGIEFTRGVQATLLGNSIDSNFGRGIDILNYSSVDANVKIGDGTEEGRNLVVGNRLEGVYVVNSADLQDQNASSTAGFLANGSLDARPNLIFQLNTNTIDDNGRDTQLQAAGLVMFVGSTNAGSPGNQADAYTVNPGSREGVGDVEANASFTEDGTNSRVNANVVGNDFQGNFGDDVFIRSFTSTVTPPTSSDNWGLLVTPIYRLGGNYRRDPLARLNLVFSGNSGNSLDVLPNSSSELAQYNNAEPVFKSRDRRNPPVQGGPAGPFPVGGGRARSAQNVASRSGLAPFSGPNAAPTSFGTVISATSGEGGEPVTITTFTSVLGQLSGGGTATPTNPGVLAIDNTMANGGFTAAPTVTITQPGATTATAQAIMNVESVQILQQGSGFIRTPTVQFQGGGGAGATGAAVLTANLTGTVIDSGGSRYVSAPAVGFSTATGSGATGSAFLRLNEANVVSTGSGYTANTAFNLVVTPPPTGGTTAVVQAQVDQNGQVAQLNIVDPGSGYTTRPTLSQPGGVPGSGASFEAFMTVDTVVLTNGGGSYVGAPDIIFSGGSPTTPATGRGTFGIQRVDVLNSGANYTSQPSLVFITPFFDPPLTPADQPSVEVFLAIDELQIISGGANFDPTNLAQIQVNITPVNGQGTATGIVTAPDLSHGLTAGDVVEITDAEVVDFVQGQIHSANGTFFIDIPTDPMTGQPDRSRFTLVGTEGTNSPDHRANTGTWVFNNPQMGVNASPGSLSFVYDGMGPSTFRVAQGFDSSGNSQQDEFNNGDNFALDSPVGGFGDPANVEIGYAIWTPLVDEADPTNPRTNSFVDPPVSTAPVAEFVAVTPDPRRQDAGIVTINFTEPVTDVGINDFRLTRNGFPVDISSIPVIQVTRSQYTIDLRSVTQIAGAPIDGDYELTLDNAAPEAQIVPVSPDPIFSDAGVLTIEFSEPVTGVDIYDFTLSRDLGDGVGFTSIDLSETGANLFVKQLSPSTYSVDLSTVTDVVGDYRFDLLDAFSGAINTATSDGTNPVNVLAINHGLTTGQTVNISGIAGIVANDEYRITVIDADNFTLNGTAGAAAGIDTFGGVFAFDPDIIDGIGLPLSDFATEAWSRSDQVPTGQIVDIALDPRDTGTPEVRVIFSEPIRVNTVGIDDFVLTRDIGNGPFPVSLAGATLIPDPNFTETISIALSPVTVATQFLIQNLADETDDPGVYRLTLTTTGTPIRDISNSRLAFADFDEWEVILDGPSPSVSVAVPGVPDEQNGTTGTYSGAVTSALVNFDEAITGIVESDDLLLIRTNTDGSAEQLDLSAVTIIDLTGFGTSFLVSNLESVTEDGAGNPIDGTYLLRLSHINDQGSATQIMNGAAQPLVIDAVVPWIIDSTAPTANILNTESSPEATDFTPSPRVDDDAGVITVLFSEPVTGVSRFNAAADFTLEIDRGDGNGYVNISNQLAGLTVRPVDPTLRSGATADPFFGGEVFASRYVLDLSDVATGLGDDGAFRLTFDGNFVDITGNEFMTGPDPDPSDQFVPPPIVEEWIRLPIETQQPTTIFDAEFSNNPLQLEARERFVIDTVAPAVGAGSVNVSPNPRNAAVGVVAINFTEGVTGVDINDFVLRRDGAVVSLAGLTVVPLSASSYTIDLNLVTGAPGAYELLLDGDGSLIQDAAGNPVSATLASLTDWVTDIIGPVAGFASVSSPRNNVPATVQVNFTEPVTVAGVDLPDFILRRDTGNGFEVVDLNAASATVTPLDESAGLATMFAIDLSGVSSDEGTYRLTLNAGSSGIVDAAGNVLALSRTVEWVVDLTAPIVDIIDIAPDPRTTAVGLVNIIFRDSSTGLPEGVVNFDISDLTLTRGGTVVPINALPLTQQTPSRYTINLSSVTDIDGDYELTVNISDITDLAGNALAQDLSDAGLIAGEAAQDIWFTGVDTTPPTVTQLNVAPDPGNLLTSNAGVVTVGFSEDVSSVDLDDFRLFLNSNPIDLAAAGVTVSPVPGTAAQYRIDLTNVTDVAGSYELQVVTADMDVRDRTGNLLEEVVALSGVAASDTWDRIVQPPTAIITDILSPRLRAVGELTITFSDPVMGVDLTPGASDFRLTRDANTTDGFPGQPVSLSGISVVRLTDTLYTIDLTSVTGVNGFYSLTLTDGGNIQTIDALPNDFISPITKTWTTDTTITVNTFSDTDDVNPGDGVVADVRGTVSLRAAIMEANALPGTDTIVLPAGTYTLTDTGAGEDFAFSGDLDIRDSLTIIGAGAGTTTIDASALGERIFQIFSGVKFDLSGVTLTGGSVTGSEDGGAIRSVGTVTISDAAIVGNTSEDDGGGINNAGVMTINRTTIAGNTAGSSGGGIRNSGTLTILSSTIGGTVDETTDLRNRSQLDGGGLINVGAGSVTIVNSTFSGNVAEVDIFGSGGRGAAISNRATLSVLNSTITNNEADVEGGGVFSSGATVSTIVRNTIIAGNMADVSGSDVSGTFTSSGNNFIGDAGTVAAFVNGVNNDQVGATGAPIDPSLGGLTNNGGPTLTHALLLGSPAIDAGDNTGIFSFDTDQRGSSRILDGDGNPTPAVDVGSTVDIGAFEFGGLFVNDSRDLPDINPGDGLLDVDPFMAGVQITLRSAIMEANALPGENTIVVPAGNFVLTQNEIDTFGPEVDTLSMDVSVTDVGTANLQFSEQVIGVDAADFTLNETRAIQSVSDSGVGPIVITTGSTQGLVSGDVLTVAGVLGNTASNGTFAITIIDGTTFSLNGTIGNGDFTGGGQWSRNVDLVAAGILVDQISSTEFSIDLSSVTQADGQYVLTLNAAGSGIQDVLGNLLLTGATATTVRGTDSFVPTVSFVPVQPDPRSNAVAAVNVNFSESVSGVGTSDFSLTQSQTILGTSGNAVGPVSIFTGSTAGLTTGSQVTITGVTGNLAANGTFTISVVDATTFTLNGTVGSGDYAGGGQWTQSINLAAAGVTVQGVGGSTSEYTISLGSVTNAIGNYVLTLDPLNAFIQDTGGNSLQVGATDAWAIVPDITAPVGTIVDVRPDPRINDAGVVSIQFDEPVTGLDISDFTLTHEFGGGPVSVDISALVVNSVSGSMSDYTIDLSTLTAADGIYTLTLNATDSNVLDAAGNTLQANDSDTWTVGEDGAITGDLDITDITGRLRIVGAGSDSTTIDANNLDRVFHVLDNVDFELFDVTVTGGLVAGGGNGGGILNSGQLLVSGSVVSGNVTDGNGGGIHSDSAGQLTLTAATISNNAARFGGGVFSDDDSTLTLANGTVVSSNTATFDGGGIYNDRRGLITVDNSSVRGNTAGRDGGGFYINDVSVTTVTDSVFEANTATRSGGGIFNEQSASLTVTNSTLTDNAAGFAGGGLFNDDGVVTIAESSVALNTSSFDAGGVFNQSAGQLTVTDTTFSANQATRDAGAIKNFGTVTLASSSFSMNIAGRDGGAVQNLSVFNVSDSEFIDNSASQGGAIQNNDIAVMTVTGTTFDGNISTLRGGGLHNTGAGRATFVDSTFNENAAGTDGGGIYHDSDDFVSIQRSTFSLNTAMGNGAGVNNQRIMEVVNSTFSGNAASGVGGGLFNGETLTITQSTIYQNSAGGVDTDADMSPDTFGGGVFNNAPFDPLTVRNTIIAGNVGGTAPDVDGFGFTTAGNNLIGDIGSATGFSDNVSGDIVGSVGSGVVDPQLGLLASNGGPTLTHALLSGSPARDAGNNVSPPATDQRGFSRIVDGDGNGVATIDIGAYESGFVSNSFADTADVFPGDRVSADLNGFSSLRASVIEANTLTGNNTIVLGAGTFTLSIPGRDEDGALTGDLDITDNLTIMGAGAGETIIDGAALDRVFDVHPGVTLNLSGVTIVGGFAETGGGIRNRGELFIDGVEIQRNSADFGGGVFTGNVVAILEAGINNVETTLTVVDGSVLPQNAPFTIVVNNEQMTVTGINEDVLTVLRGVNGTTAANHITGANVVVQGQTTIINSLIGGRFNGPETVSEGNTANEQGGGLFNEGILVVNGSIISANQANAQGGGVFNDGTATFTTTTIGGVNSGDDRFGNVSDSRGGGIYNIHRFTTLASAVNNTVSTLVVNDASDFSGTPSFDLRIGSEEVRVTAIAGNTFTITRGVNGTLATDHLQGEVVSLIGQSEVTIVRSTIAGNRASSNGAGVFNGSELIVTGSTFSDNQANGVGGGIATVGATSIRNTTITANSTVTRGGGVANLGANDVRVRNTIIAFNSATAVTVPDSDTFGAFISDGTNLIGDVGTATGFTNGVNQDQVGSTSSPFDPVLGPLADNGGPTLTHALLVGSPAIDNGDNTGGSDIDQRGEPRPTDVSADIGAFELGAVSIAIDNVAFAEGDSGQTPMVFTLRLSRPTIQPVSVNYSVIAGLVIVDPMSGGNLNDTALAGDDFLPDLGTITFTPGELTATLTVLVNGDTVIEPNETFDVVLSNPMNAILVAGGGAAQTTITGVGTILNDDTSVSISDVAQRELDSGTSAFDFTVSLSEPTVETIVVDFTTSAGPGPNPATAGIDYQAQAGMLTFAPGETSKTVSVLVAGDTSSELFETFAVDLTVTSGSAQLLDGQGLGTIQNDDVRLIVTGGSINEDTGANTLLPFVVTMVADDGTTPVENALEVTVDVSTADVSLPDVTAISGSDYIALAGLTVTIPVGMTAATQNVTVIGDTVFEGGVSSTTPEEFTLGFDAGSVTLGGQPYTEVTTTLGLPATGTIIDDELPPTVWVIRATAANPTTIGELFRDGTDDGVFNPLFVRNFALTGNTETVMGDPGTQNDRFIVDFVNGNPIPDGGLVIDGGEETSGDSLEIVDTDGLTPFTFDSVVYTSTGVDSGTIVIDDGVMVPTRTITYAELEPVLDTVAAVNRTFTINSVANPGDHVIDVANAGGRTIISDSGTSAFESVEFANPTSTLTLNAGDGSNTITVGALDAGFAASFTIDAEDGDDSLIATATNIALSIVGGDGADTLVGGTLNDTIDGGAGNDSIDGGDGNDSLAGGTDNDTVKGGAGTDSIDGGAGNDLIEGGTENDTLLGGTEDDTILGEEGDDSIDGDAGTDSLDGGAGNDTITGGDGGDSIVGGAGQDSLDGGGDADTLDGGDDDDTVIGGSGTDIVAGGLGDDSVDGGSDNDTLSGGGGTDILVGGTGDDQVAEVAVDAESIFLTNTVLTVGGLADSVNGVEEFILTGGDLSSLIDASAYTLGNVTINGEGGDDTLIGSDGDDFINGGSDNDTLIGGLGNDSMFGGSGSDNIDGGSSNDTLFGNAGDDTLNGGTGQDSLSGGQNDDLINGGDDNDTALGGAGDDTINGGLGFDRILGEAGDDTLNGDDGNDTLIGGIGGDVIRGGAGIDNLNGQSGRDDLDGGADDDTAFGGAGQDTLTGGQGIDNLDGQGSSFDIIRLIGEATDDVFTLDRSNNFNQLRKTSGTTYGVNFKRTETIEINTLDGNDTITVIGDLNGSDGDAAFVIAFGNGNNTLDASLNTDPGKSFIVTAGTGNDTLKGSAGDDNLNGASGDDSIDGGAGEDTLTGGAGADVLNGDAGADLINGGTENDTISGGSEQDTLIAGAGDDSVHGNEGDDTILGEDGNDLLYGDAGNDSILGGRDDDSIDGGDNDDTILGERGFDLIKGGSGNDSLVGGDHNDTIDGGNGNDLVNGNLGNDVLLGGNGNDLVNGNEGEDVLLGGADNDVLLGGRDADTLLGGTGADDIRGQGSSVDVLVGETGLADDTPDPGDTFDSFALNTPSEIDNVFVLDTAILDQLNSF